jgi:UDP-glucose 4-epimerase
MKRALITGASGRIGRHLIPSLLDHDYKVRALVHRTALPDNWANEVEAVETGLLDDEALAAALDGVDVVCHLAALMPPAAEDDIFRVNLEGTYRLLQAIKCCRKKPRFVFASSDATYCTGWSRGPYTAPIDENTEQRPMLFYGVSKVLGERLCFHYQDIEKIPTVRLRLVWILEAREVLDLFIGAPYKEFLVAEDRGKWDDPCIVKVPLEEDGAPFSEHICDVRDAAQGVFLAMDREEAAGHVFNIAGPASFTYSAAAPWLAAKLGVNAVAGRCSGIHSYTICIAAARTVLGYQPGRSVFDSLEDALTLKTASSIDR